MTPCVTLSPSPLTHYNISRKNFWTCFPSYWRQIKIPTSCLHKPPYTSVKICSMVEPYQKLFPHFYRAQWLRGRASDSQLREPGFESCAAVLKPWGSFITLHCSSSLSCINEYLAIDSGGYVYKQSSLSHINCDMCKALWAVLMTGYCAI